MPKESNIVYQWQASQFFYVAHFIRTALHAALYSSRYVLCMKSNRKVISCCQHKNVVGMDI